MMPPAVAALEKSAPGATDEDEEIEAAEIEEHDNDEGSVGTMDEEWAHEWKVTSVQSWWVTGFVHRPTLQRLEFMGLGSTVNFTKPSASVKLVRGACMDGSKQVHLCSPNFLVFVKQIVLEPH